MNFDFSKKEYEFILEEAMLKNDERQLDKILEMKIKGYSRVKIADELNISIELVDKRVKILKKKINKII